ncbi:hypothetical protein BC936DRAFT_139612 [Jimgerdemannia flammicorona]|uniref:Zinc finger CCCH-type with G patch domain-containing protein n=1 Tax=Jimgerdemannia flammicorona TaxID=994334 RepID=A0A433B9I6_9FUNG|nr:hypothetical protein BC936DRAFT_139612 [Jimgerdemannia flammicorona]
MATSDTEAALAETRSQLAEIQQLLALDPTNPDLLGMCSDLAELQALQERSLLEEKRAALLGLYGGQDDETNPVPAVEPDPVPLPAPTPDEYPPGSKCCIPFPHARTPTSSSRYYLLPALVLSHTTTQDSPTTSVLLLTPPTPSTRPCDSFLHSLCTPGPRCRHSRSHGHPIATDLLLPYEALEVDRLENYQPGRRVWCHYDADNVWYLARVVEVVKGGGEWRVRFTGYGEDEEVVVGHESVMPVKCVDDEDEDGSDEENEEEEEGSWSEGSSVGSSEDDEDTLERTSMAVLHEPLHRSALGGEAVALGQWEAHTRGVASRMMERMGYKMGEGLGLTSTGRLEPIEVELHAKGRSLDYLDEGRPGGSGSGGKRKHRHRHHHKPSAAGDSNDPASEERRARRKRKRDALGGADGRGVRVGDGDGDSGGTVFDFLNTSLSLSKPPPSTNSSSASSTRKNSSTPVTTKHMHVTLARLADEIKTAQGDLARAQGSLARNKGTELEGVFRAKVAECAGKVETLKRRESEVQGGVLIVISTYDIRLFPDTSLRILGIRMHVCSPHTFSRATICPMLIVGKTTIQSSANS